MRSFLLVVLALVLAAPGRAAPAPERTGRYIIRLKETPPPPRLLRIADRLEGTAQVAAGGKRSPYLLVRPKKPHVFILPTPLKSLVAYIEPEVVMYAQSPGMGSEGGPSRLAAARIGRPASGSREQVPRAAETLGAPRIPNDPQFAYQWGLADSGFGIHLPTARRYTLGAGVMVGIVDSGVRTDLPDLAGTSFLPSYNALLTKLDGADDNGHGSHVCGTIAQTTDNRLGCAGIAPAARILPVKALDANGKGSNFTIGVGIRYAVDKGCSVINLSIGGVASQTLKDAIQYAHGRNVLVVAAAGNAGNGALTYPARYPETLSVGAIESAGHRASFSQYGQGLSLVAPGEEILQQTFSRQTGKPGYYYYSGTSMATPMVTGVAALVKSLRPSLTCLEVKALLQATCTDLGPRGYDVEYGAGLLNAAQACARAAGGDIPAPPAPTPTPIPPVPPTTVPPPEQDTLLQETLKLFNEARSQAGLPAVALEPRLTAAAVAHARDMRTRGVMSHTGGDGSNPGERISRAGYPWRTYGEIIAQGQPTPSVVTSAWMNSPGHRAIILGQQFTEVGIAKDGAYWAACWGAR